MEASLDYKQGMVCLILNYDLWSWRDCVMPNLQWHEPPLFKEWPDLGTLYDKYMILRTYSYNLRLQRYFVPGLAEIGSESLGSGDERLSNFVKVFLLLLYYLPLEKDLNLLWKKPYIPFTKGCLIPSLVEIGLVVMEKKMKIEAYKQTDGLTDNRR